MGSATSDPSQSEDSAAKKESLPFGGKNKRELVRPALLPLSSQLTIGLVIPLINGDNDLKVISLTTVGVDYCSCVNHDAVVSAILSVFISI